MEQRVTHSLVRALQDVPGFDSLDERMLLALIGDSANLYWPVGSIVFKRGGSSDGLYIVISGCVHVLAEDGSIRNVAVAHSDPDKVRWARELNRRYPPEASDEGGVANVIRTGRSELYRDIPDELLVSGARDAEQEPGEPAAGDQELDIVAHGYPWACSTLPPTVTGFAAISTKAITQGSVPRLTQLWMVPRCTRTSPARRCTSVPSSCMSISPESTTA